MHLSKEELFKLFTVDFEKGEIYNKYDRTYNSKAGDIGGNIKEGRRVVRVGNKKQIYVHRVIYQMYYGDLTSKYLIDHIDGNPLNNSIHNLRKVTKGQNNSNLRGNRKNNTSGVRGVHSWKSLDTGREYWVARVHKNGSYVFQKSFRKEEYTLEEVAKVVEEKRRIHFGEYAGTS